jgi:hypothetical protein
VAVADPVVEPAECVVVRRVETAVAVAFADPASVTPATVRWPLRYGAGSSAWPSRRTSKWTCGPVQLPVQPT